MEGGVAWSARASWPWCLNVRLRREWLMGLWLSRAELPMAPTLAPFLS